MTAVGSTGSLWGTSWAISAGGIQNAQLKMAITAHNIASGNTDGFIPDRVDSIALTKGGVAGVILPGEPVPNAKSYPDGTVPSQTDYATELLRMVLAKNAYQANAKVFEGQNEVSRYL